MSEMVIRQMARVREAAASIEAASVQRLLMASEVKAAKRALLVAHPKIAERQGALKSQRRKATSTMAQAHVAEVDAAVAELNVRGSTCRR